MARSLVRPLVGFAAAAALVSIAWLRVEGGSLPLGDVLRVVVLALLPTLAIAFQRGRRVVVGILLVASLLAAGSGFGVSPLEARPGKEHDFFGPVLGSVRGGFQDFYDATLPFNRVDYPAMYGLVLLAVFGFVAAVGILIALRRPLGASLVLLVALGWPATLYAGERPLVSGGMTLAGILLFLVLFRGGAHTPRSLGPAIAVAALLVLAAVGSATSEAVAKGAFLRWQSWDLYDRPEDPVGVRYVWNSGYDGISFPKKKTVVLRIHVDGPRRPLYWRATTLDDYNGEAWIETSDFGGPRRVTGELDVGSLDPLLPAQAFRERDWIRQDVTVEALDDDHLIASGQPVKWKPGTSTTLRVGPGGTVILEGSLRQRQRYTGWSYVPRAKPSDLADAPAVYPDELDPGYLQPLEGVSVPAFGRPGRDEAMEELFATTTDSFLREHRSMYRIARQLTGKARSPYAAAVAVEAWFRSPEAGGFEYDESPPRSFERVPPLVDFLQTRRGYCQHYAGAMTLMLRFLGVPARVAAGFTSGTYNADKHEWTVTDHNAHTWVEVYFPGYGWLAFDPTPGRGQLDAAYSPFSEKFARRSAAQAGLERILGSRFFTDVPGGTDNPNALRTRRNENLAIGEAGGGASVPSRGRGGGSLLRLIALLLAAAAILLVAVKAVHRRIRFASRDPRRIAAACRRDLVGFLADQGVEAPPSATLGELGELLEEEFIVDPERYVSLLTAARFGPPAGAAPALEGARRELRLLRREMRRQLGVVRRVRGALSVRSLTV